MRAFFIARKEAAGVKAWAEQFYNSDAWRVCREACEGFFYCPKGGGRREGMG
nr:MAG TPA: hypothetical protein [Caudoviricetes sp.]